MNRCESHQRASHQRAGAVLIVVFVILMMVSLAAYHFTISMESEHLAIRNGGDQIVARQCALSGIELVASILQQPHRDRGQLETVVGIPIDLWPTESPGGEGYRASILASDMPSDTSDPLANSDESAKLNLRILLEWDRIRSGAAREALLRLPQMDESTADQLLDWINPDSEARLQSDASGADNALPLSVDELAFMGAKPTDDPLTDDIDGLDQPPAWINHLTVHSAERNEAFDGQPRIFLNTDDLGDLHRQLSERASAPIADFVIWVRQYGVQQATDSQTDQASADRSSSLSQVDLSVPASHQITDLTELIDSLVVLPSQPETDQPAADGAEPLPKRVRSPMMIGAGVSGGPPLDELFDQFTLTTQARIVGRINVLTAPAEVLAAIPGLGESLAEQIVSQRQNSDRSFRHPIGLLSSLSVDSTIVKEVLPYMTVVGDVVRVRVSGWIRSEPDDLSSQDRPSYHCEVILDASSGPASQVVFRQISGPTAPSPSTLLPSTTFPTAKTRPTAEFISP